MDGLLVGEKAQQRYCTCMLSMCVSSFNSTIKTIMDIIEMIALIEVFERIFTRKRENIEEFNIIIFKLIF